LATKLDQGTLKDSLRAVWRQRAEAPVAAPPAKPPASTGNEADEQALFRKAMSGTQVLPDTNRVILAKPPSRRIVAARSPADDNQPRRRTAGDDALPTSWQDDTRPRRLPDDPEQAALMLAMAGVAPLPDKNLAELNKPVPRPAPRPLGDPGRSRPARAEP